eukprot:856464_1
MMVLANYSFRYHRFVDFQNGARSQDDVIRSQPHSTSLARPLMGEGQQKVFSLTPEIDAVISELLQEETLNAVERSLVRQYSSHRNIQKPKKIAESHLYFLTKLSKKYTKNNVSVDTLTSSSEITYAPKEAVCKDPEFSAFLDRMRSLEEHRRYTSMVANVLPAHQRANLGAHTEDTARGITEELPGIHLAGAAFAVISSFLAGFYIGKSVFHSTTTAAMCGSLLMMFALLVEVWIYIRRTTKPSDRRISNTSGSQGRRRKEYRKGVSHEKIE